MWILSAGFIEYEDFAPHLWNSFFLQRRVARDQALADCHVFRFKHGSNEFVDFMQDVFVAFSHNEHTARSENHEGYFIMRFRVIPRLFVLVGFIPHEMQWLLPGLFAELHPLHVEELALNAWIRTRIVVAVDAVLVFQQVIQRIAVDVIPALEIGIDEHRFTLVALEIEVVAEDGL